jgi:hypothetical protein
MSFYHIDSTTHDCSKFIFLDRGDGISFSHVRTIAFTSCHFLSVN